MAIPPSDSFFSNFINSPPRPIHVYQAPFSFSAFFNIKEIFFSLSNCPNHFRLVLSCWIAAAKIYLEGRIRSGTLPTNYYAIQWTFVSPCWEHSHALFFASDFFSSFKHRTEKDEIRKCISRSKSGEGKTIIKRRKPFHTPRLFRDGE